MPRRNFRAGLPGCTSAAETVPAATPAAVAVLAVLRKPRRDIMDMTATPQVEGGGFSVAVIIEIFFGSTGESRANACPNRRRMGDCLPEGEYWSDEQHHQTAF